MRQQEELIRWSEYAAVLRHGWGGILLFSVVGCAAAFVATERQTPIYESAVELVVEQPFLQSGVAGGSTPFDSWDDTFVHTQKRVLQSDLLATKAVDIVLARIDASSEAEARPGPAAAATNAPGMFARLRALYHTPSGESMEHYVRNRSRDTLVAELSKGLTVSSTARTRIFDIEVRSPCPALAAAAARAVAQSYADYIAETFSSSAAQTFRLLKRQADEARESIERAAMQVLEFRKRSEVDSFAAAVSGVNSLGPEQTALIKEKLSGANADIGALRDDLLETEQNIESLSRRYKPKHPKIQELADRSRLLKRKIEELIERAFLEWERRHLEDQKQVEYSVLEQDMEATRRLHEALVEKMKQIDLSQEAPSALVRVLREPEVPLRPAYPNKARSVFLGGISGLLLGIVVAFLRAYSRSNLVSLSVQDADLPGPVIGRLPQITDKAELGAFLRGEDVSFPQVEQFKALRTNIEAISRPGSNIILITSPDRGDGKSTISVAIARSFAHLGRRVLLVDVDLRRGNLQAMFPLDFKGGMAELLAGDTSVEPVEVSSMLDFIPCGRHPKHPVELLDSAAMWDYFAKAAQEYHAIILDSPPVLPVTDAAVLARRADLRLLVVRSLQTHLDACRLAGQTLANLGCPVDGTILNGVKTAEASYHSYYRRYYGRSYEAEPKRQ